MRKIIVIVVLAVTAGLAARMAARAARRAAPETTTLLWLLIYTAASPALTKNTPRATATKARVDKIIPALGTLNTAVSTLNTAVAGCLPLSGGTITGDLHITGNLYGTGGTLTIQDAVHVVDVLTADSTLTTHGAVRGSSTTGDGAQGSVAANTDSDGTLGVISNSQTLTGLIGNCNTIISRLNNLMAYHNGTNGDLQGCVNRVNDLLTALG